MISSKQISKALVSSLKDGISPDNVLKNFEKFLKENHLIPLIPNIIKSLEEEIRKIEKEDTLDIKVSHKISKDLIKDIESFVKKDSVGETVVKEDADLIGGFTAKYKGMIYDGSVKNYLKELKVILMK